MATDDKRIDFRLEVEPLLIRSCRQCHGLEKAAGQLRLDNRAALLRGGVSGEAIAPGRGRESLLVKRVLGEGGQVRMPMGGDPLTPVEISRLTRWIDEGAEWPGSEAVTALAPRHWAYIPPGQSSLPKVKANQLVRNPIDNFVLARLEQEGLSFSPPAGKEALLRRVSLDLIGLPPTLAETEQFLADNSPEAYERLVDRLLASRHYGERWARPWLDLARYADSHGYESDGLRVMWKYRDWVIDALNRDMPFNQFTVEQIAGDMLPEPTKEQLIATGFHRNTLLNREGGTDGDEQRYEVLVDRVNTTATVWLGSTLGCAQCHNHKYDPFTQKDYYRMYAFFENAEYRIGTEPFQRFVYEPDLELPTPEQDEKRRQLKAELTTIERSLKEVTTAMSVAQVKWESEMVAEPQRWVVLDPASFTSTGGAELTELPDHSLLASGVAPELDDYVISGTIDPKSLGSAKRLTALRIEALTDQSLPRGGPGRDLYGNFILTTVEARLDGHLLKFADADWDNGVNRIDKKNFFNPFEPGQVTDRPRGWLINAMADETRLTRQMVLMLDQPIVLNKPVTIEVKLIFRAGGLNEAMGRVRLSATGIDNPMRLVEIPAAQRLVLEKPLEKRNEIEKRGLTELFRRVTPLLKSERDRAKQIEEALESLGIVKAMITRERPGYDRPSTWLRERGNFASHAERVYAGTPAALHPLPENAPTNRLGLARWLVDEANPLVARVLVNRAWEQFFGRGIVETSEDFGSQAAAPTHRELLDWLAVEFVKQGWSQKALHRMIVMSTTYRQDSVVTPLGLERDPFNRLLARGPRFRVEAEMIRDLALTASGLLNRRIGGPSVMPPQPEGIWRNPYSRERWVTAKGGDRYRRGIYTFLRRTSPYPSLMTFDATSREFCTVRRVRTNTPLQSLTLLNDETMLEMARALARRLITEGGGTPQDRLNYGFRLCLTRRPTEAELARMVALYQQQLVNYQLDPVAARKLVSVDSPELAVSELAALTVVSNVLLNLDEMVTKQ